MGVPISFLHFSQILRSGGLLPTLAAGSVRNCEVRITTCASSRRNELKLTSTGDEPTNAHCCAKIQVSGAHVVVEDNRHSRNYKLGGQSVIPSIMQTRLVEYFLALEREGHFARAAASCNVSQPSLSAGIASLEEQLGKRLIRRDRKFVGLTPEGEAILPWARQLVATAEAMEQAAETARGPLKGELRLGSIPAAMPVIGSLADRMLTRHPGLNISLRALTSRRIERELAAFELDAGITYLDFEPPAHALSVALYSERTMLVSAVDGIPIPDPLGWADLARLPLCLLHQGMQNRRILDSRLTERGLALQPRVTADSYIALLSLVQHSRLCSIIPDSHAALLDGLSWARTYALPEMTEGSRIGVIVADSAPLGPLAQAVLSTARELQLSHDFEKL